MIAIVFDGHAEARVRAQNERAWLAWHIAALMRSEKLPRLDALMTKPGAARKPRTQSPEERWQAMVAASRMKH